jgi:hypothetical protein
MFWGQAVGGSNPPSPTPLDRGGQLRSPRRLNSVASADTTPAARAVQISERQLADAAAMIAVSGDTLDWEHLQRWVDALSLSDHLRMAIGDGPQDA